MDFSKLDCLLINLDRSPERLIKMQERLACFKLTFRKISAVDGKNVIFTEKEINTMEYERCHGKYVVPTEVGCYLSHYKALQSFLEGDKEFALIIEDDMEFRDDFPVVLNELIKHHHNWDMIKLNGTDEKPLSITQKKILTNYRVVYSLSHQAKSGAYLINRYAAQNYLKELLPMTVPYDHEFIKFWKYDIRLFTVVPFPAYEEIGASTIDYTMAKRNKKPWYKKFNTYAYRTNIALKPFWYVVKKIITFTK